MTPARHLPAKVMDAAGQTTTYTYNARGQLLTRTNARGETIAHVYDANGYLTAIDGPLPGSSIVFTYDGFGRVRTKTDESGYTLTFDYDALDRLTTITFPDGTSDQFTYTRLDLTLLRDRAGRQTSVDFNNVRQMIKRTDPLGRVTLFQWCKCGALKSLTDPIGRTTGWQHDIRGRVKSKEYADGAKVTYRYENTISRLRLRIDEKLQVTQFDYNRDDTLSRISYTQLRRADGGRRLRLRRGLPATAFHDRRHRHDALSLCSRQCGQFSRRRAVDECRWSARR